MNWIPTARYQPCGAGHRVFVPLPEVAPPDAAALAVNLAFNNPELTTIAPISLDEAEELVSPSSPALNPQEQGLPGDLTAELAAAVNLQVREAWCEKKKKDGTLLFLGVGIVPCCSTCAMGAKPFLIVLL